MSVETCLLAVKRFDCHRIGGQIELNDAGDVVGYGRTDRYRRNEMRSNEDL
ncbi:hypothetical protein ACFQL3_12290 [Natronoarchaeum sp. GCM10025321]|uniref:hypothetical protein n=1 Tax=Natronoarchaeum sp. GCM10025321 TaxID=3252684 RepID=UPI003615561C